MKGWIQRREISRMGHNRIRPHREIIGSVLLNQISDFIVSDDIQIEDHCLLQQSICTCIVPSHMDSSSDTYMTL